MESAARRVVAPEHKVENVNHEESVLPRARRKSVLQGEGAHHSHRVARGPHAHHARRESAQYASRESGPRAPGEPEVLQRKLQLFKRRRKPPRLRYLQFRKFRRPRHRRLRHHRHLHRAMARLRASRGDSKPCYWHHHDISTASNIEVA